jgi:ESCRT-I complex subunit MVB12
VYQLDINVFENVINIMIHRSIYILYFLAYDEPSRDADLMADSILERKDRFLCFTRAYPLAENKTLVLEDIKLINERDSLTPQYTALTQTVDTRERGTSKRVICVKLVERQAGMKCICDIIFLYRSKRPPQFYTLIGEINGLQMCIKEGTVPALRAPPPIPTSNLYPDPLNFNPSHNMDTNEHLHMNTLSKKSDEKEILDDIPFEINSKYLVSNRTGANDLLGIDSYQILSTYELEQQFNYDFTLERSHIS